MRYLPAMGWVQFFDGECAFCSRSVQVVSRLDKGERISFAPLQGKLSQEHGFTRHAVPGGGTMVVLRESDGRVFTHSDAWIELMRALGGGWRVFGLVRFIPRFIRDAAYGWVARNRYRFMGKSASCALPDAAMLKRMRE